MGKQPRKPEPPWLVSDEADLPPGFVRIDPEVAKRAADALEQAMHRAGYVRQRQSEGGRKGGQNNNELRRAAADKHRRMVERYIANADEPPSQRRAAVDLGLSRTTIAKYWRK